MTQMTLLAYHHGFAYGGGWIAHMVVSSAIHAVIYSFMFRLLHHLTTGEMALLVIALVVGLLMWSRARDRRTW